MAAQADLTVTSPAAVHVGLPFCAGPDLSAAAIRRVTQRYLGLMVIPIVAIAAVTMVRIIVARESQRPTCASA